MSKKNKTPLPNLHTNRYTITSNAKGKIEIKDRENPKTTYVAPTVYFTPKAMEMSKYIVEQSPDEVAWMAITQLLPNHDILVTDSIYIPKQTVTAASVDVDEDAMTDLAMRVADDHGDTSNLLSHFHSHVNMGVSPSTVDNDQTEEYFESNPPYFVRGIFNKKGDIRVDVFYPNLLIGFNAVEVKLHLPDQAIPKKELSDLLNEQVSRQRWVGGSYTGHNGYGGYSGYCSPGMTQQNSLADNDTLGLGDSNWIDTGFNTDWNEDTPVSERPNFWWADDSYLWELDYSDMSDVRAGVNSSDDLDVLKPVIRAN